MLVGELEHTLLAHLPRDADVHVPMYAFQWERFSIEANTLTSSDTARPFVHASAIR